MSKASRYRVNAVVCVLALVYALYWFATERSEATPGWRIALMGALVVLGIGGAAWFFRRARGATH
jgi:cobalamin biosynthesis Mg chelatase CobN